MNKSSKKRLKELWKFQSKFRLMLINLMKELLKNLMKLLERMLFGMRKLLILMKEILVIIKMLKY